MMDHSEIIDALREGAQELVDDCRDEVLREYVEENMAGAMEQAVDNIIDKARRNGGCAELDARAQVQESIEYADLDMVQMAENWIENNITASDVWDWAIDSDYADEAQEIADSLLDEYTPPITPVVTMIPKVEITSDAPRPHFLRCTKPQEDGAILFWNNVTGWGLLDSCTYFSDEEKLNIPYTPMDSEWIVRLIEGEE